MESVITRTSRCRSHHIIRAIQQTVWTVPVALLEIHALQMATVTVLLDFSTEAGVRTSPGNRRTAALIVETVRNWPRSKKHIDFYEDIADTTTAAIHSFSNLYPCPLQNGSFTGSWCCGAQGGTQAAKAGCCGTAFELDFGSVVIPDTEAKTINTISSTLASSSSHIASAPSSAASSTSLGLSRSKITPSPTPVEISPGPAQQSQKSLTVGVGVGIPAVALLLFSLVFLFLRERRRRVQAQKMTDDASTAPVGGDRERKGENGRTTARDYELQNYQLPQELEYVQQGPEEIYSQEVHEANGIF